MKGEGLLLHLSYAALLPNPLPLGGCGQSLGAAELLNLGSRVLPAEDSLHLPAP